MLLRIFILAMIRYGRPVKALFALKRIIDKRRKIQGNTFVLKYARADGRYFVALNIPGWPSLAYDSFFKSEFDRLDNKKPGHHKLHTAIFSITSRCSFHCEHCYEWANITSEELLSMDELQIIQEKLHKQGICHLQYSGGEPLSRMDALLALLSRRKADVDYWILSSGFNMTYADARRLKDNGLTGAVISLDHWDADLHNAFRKHPKSFYWAREAVIQCKRANLATGLSICATRDFISKPDLWKFADLAKSWGVGFIRILEPRRSGAYKGQEVQLTREHIATLERFFLEVNSKRACRDYPIVTYPGYHQRKVGCLGAGNRYIYIDSKGDIHACPFCQDQKGNALRDDLNDSIGSLQETGCHQFKSNLLE